MQIGSVDVPHDGKFQAVGFRPAGNQADDGFGDLRAVNQAFFQVPVSGLNLRDIKNIIDDLKQVATAGMDIGGIGLVVLVADGPKQFILDHFRTADDGVQRRAQFVGDGYHEF